MADGHTPFNATKDNGNYSAPVPMIGLYIAGATSVCLLLIVYDLIHAYRSRRSWIPCRFSTLNSFTLTVLGVVTKIPVDLTTPMPNGHEQLAKLCGTIILFIFMVLFLPSIGNMETSSRLANVASMTLIVITIVVNICLQIGTGLIFKFVAEHVIIFVLMLLLLSMMWSSMLEVDSMFKVLVSTYKIDLKDEKSRGGNMIRGIMNYCVYSHSREPELVRCKLSHHPTMGLLCAICLVVLLEATFRALDWKKLAFSGQNASDYKWSMWFVVGTQIVTITIGCASIGFKCLVLGSQMKPFRFEVWKHVDFLLYQRTRSFVPYFQNSYLPKSLSRSCILETSQVLQDIVSFVQFAIDIGMDWIDQLLVFSIVNMKRLMGKCLGIFKKNKKGEDQSIHHDQLGPFPLDEVFRTWKNKKGEDQSIHHDQLGAFSLDEVFRTWKNKKGGDQSIHHDQLGPFPLDEVFRTWMFKKSLENITMLILKERVEPSSSHLIPLLSRYPNPSFIQNLTSMEGQIKDEFILTTILVRIIDAILPSDLTRSLLSAFDEVFDALCFILENTRSKSLESDIYMSVARDYWMCRHSNNHFFQKGFIKPLKRWINKSNLGVGPALQAFRPGSTSLSRSVIGTVVDIIKPQERESLQELHKRLEELFVSLLHRFINRLPEAISHYMVESPPHDFLRRASLCLKFLCKLNLFDVFIVVPWSEANIVKFITRDYVTPTSIMVAVLHMYLSPSYDWLAVHGNENVDRDNDEYSGPSGTTNNDDDDDDDADDEITPV
ncbi:hypothetical protein Syun_030645 [Stephania yunnanensis]|uniref:Uncharacterized protein n=1 Tax=Stephania yunnanensis TaxID=152371 RepID=A0AAP0HE60_9MAGN